LSPGDADCQLLFGLLAVQLKLASLEQISRALESWRTCRDSSLARLLCEQGALDEAGGVIIASAVEHHLAMAQGDPRRGLAAFGGSDALRTLSGVLERTVNLPVPTEPTIAKTGAVPFPLTTPANGHAAPFEPATEAAAPASEPDDRTESYGGDAKQAAAFQILRPLARGGLGELFVARDGSLNREVALKLILPGQAADEQSKARFLLEAEITGGLEHPGIVPVYALGTHADGRPFYAMRLVRGETLKERIRKFYKSATSRRQTRELRQLLNHFVRVCEVVAYAHSRGVIHRDLKPSNVMLGKFGETLVVDWGLAKPIARSGDSLGEVDDEISLRPASGSSVQATLHGAAMGTPQYMSPEQAMGQLDRLGPASDVYSLGATLYCILTGGPPLADITDVGEILHNVALGQIPAPTSLKPDAPATLEAICKKAMCPRPEDRYASALQLAADVESWLADEPPAGVREPLSMRLGRWERRHRAFLRVTGLAMIVVAVVSLLAAVGVNAARERAESRRRQAVRLGEIAENRKLEADQKRDALRRLTTRLSFDRGLSLLANNERRAGLLWLARSLESAAGTSDAFEPAIRKNLTAWSRAVDRLSGCLEHQGPVRAIAWGPAGQSVATGGDDGIARIWDPVTGEPVGAPMAHAGALRALAFAPDGKTLATAGDDQIARLWNAASGLPRGEPMHHQGPVTALAFDPAGTTLVTGSEDGKLRLWEPATGQPRGQPLEQGRPVRSLVMSPQGSLVACIDDSGALVLWNLETRQRRSLLPYRQDTIRAAAFSPDGKRLVCGGEERFPRLIDVSTAEVIANGSSERQGGAILTVAFAPDGTKVATGSYDTACRIWSVPDLRITGTARMDHRGHVWAVAFSPDSSLLASAADDNTAQLWHVADCRKAGDALPHSGPVRVVAFSEDGRKLLTGSEDRAARIWQLGDGPAMGQRMEHSDGVRALAARPDGKAFATASGDGAVSLWDALSTRLIARQPAHRQVARYELAFNPAGSVLVSSSQDGTIRLYSGSTLDPIGPTIKVPGWPRRLAISPDGTTLVAGGQNGLLGFWDARTGAALAPMGRSPQNVTALAFNNDGTRLAVCHESGEIRIWDMSRFVPSGEPMRHKGAVPTAAFSPDPGAPARLATGSYDKTARIWDARSMKPIGQPLAHRGYVWSVRFSPDGARLLTASFDGTAQIWDGHTGRSIGEPLKHGEMLYGAIFNDDASIVATFGRSTAAKLWDAATSRQLGDSLAHGNEVNAAQFLADREAIVTVSQDRTARVWSVPRALSGAPERISRKLTVLTGMELGDDDVVRVLDVSAWKSRRDALTAEGDETADQP
jgi:eukaryotic-like serine/threonine-protein kinase